MNISLPIILTVALTGSLTHASSAQQRGAELLRQPALFTAPPALPQPMLAPPAPATNQVTLTWSPSPGSNVAGYNIYVGSASRSYTNKLDVGNVTNATVGGLSFEITNFFAATAYNILGVESDYSDEVSYFPTNEPALTNVLIAVSAEMSDSINGPWIAVPHSVFFSQPIPSVKSFFGQRLIRFATTT